MIQLPGHSVFPVAVHYIKKNKKLPYWLNRLTIHNMHNIYKLGHETFLS